MSDVSITKQGAQFSWASVFKLLGLLLPLAVTCLMLWLGKEFASHTEVSAAVQPYEALPARVQSLDEFRVRQEKAQERSENKFEAVQLSIATLSAQQSSTDKKVDRVLDVLDRMQRRADK
jgi:hypothetical protein